MAEEFMLEAPEDDDGGAEVPTVLVDDSVSVLGPARNFSGWESRWLEQRTTNLTLSL